MKAVKFIFRINSSEIISRNAKKSVKIFNGNIMKRVQVSANHDKQNIEISYNSSSEGIIQSRIYSLTGYEVFSKNTALRLGENILKISCNSISDGMFIVETAIHDLKEGLLTTYNKIEIKTLNN